MLASMCFHGHERNLRLKEFELLFPKPKGKKELRGWFGQARSLARERKAAHRSVGVLSRLRGYTGVKKTPKSEPT